MICGIFTSKLEIPEEGNLYWQSLLYHNLPEGAFNMLVILAQPSEMVLSNRQAGCSNYGQQRLNFFLKSNLKSVKSAEDTSL